MKVEEIREIAKQHKISVNKLTKNELVQAIQRAEGYTNCFNSNSSGQCGQLNCLWRNDCV